MPSGNINVGNLEIGIVTKDEASKKIDALQQKTDALEKQKTVSMGADTKKADKDIGEVKSTVDDLTKKDKIVTIDAETESAESKLNTVVNILKGAGLIGATKKVIEVGIDLATSANDKEQIIEKAKSMLGDAYGDIEAYAERMNDQYGLNTTNTISMMTDFTGAFKGIGADTRTAVGYAERMYAAAMDYAAALNKTPAEVASTMMSLMRGNTEVADNLGLFGLTADKLKEAGEELAANGLIPEGLDESAYKFVALMNMLESNAQNLGYAGAYEREALTFGSQANVLSDQWQTLKESAGAFLLPAATAITTGLNTIINAINDFISDTNGKNAAQAALDAMGTAQLTEEEINKRVANVTEPMTRTLAAINEQKDALTQAAGGYKTAAEDLQRTLLLAYTEGVSYASGETGEGDTARTDDIANKLKSYTDSMMGLAQQAQTYAIQTYLALYSVDGSQIDQHAMEIAGIIGSYYDTIIGELEQKQDEFQKVIAAGLEDQWQGGQLEQALGILDEMNEILYGSMEDRIGASMAKVTQSGAWSTMSLEEQIEALTAGVSAEQKK